MNRDLLRSLAKAIGGRVKSYLLQTAKDEAARAIRHFRAGLRSSGQPAGPAALPASGPSAPSLPSQTAAPSSTVAKPESGGSAGAVSPLQAAPVEASEPQRPTRAAAATNAAARSDSKRSAKPQAEPAEGVVNINAAPKEELMSLPGIGEARADAIIKGRPFAATTDLVDRKVLPASVAEGLKGRIGVA